MNRRIDAFHDILAPIGMAINHYERDRKAATAAGADADSLTEGPSKPSN